MPEISIVVPVYKVEEYLPRCLESILGQTYADFELVLVNDGSPDKCGDICEDYAKKDQRIHVIHQNNHGLSAARNKGIDWVFKNSNSTWITFIDSDDWVAPDYLETLYMAVKSHKKNIAIGRFVESTGYEIPMEGKRTISVWKTSDFYLENTVNATVAWGKLYKKTCFASFRFPVGKLHEDEFLIYKILFKYAEVVVSDQPIYAYYQNPQGISKQIWSLKRLDALDALEQQVAFFERGGYDNIAEQRFKILVNDNIVWQDRIINNNFIDASSKKYVVKNLRNQLMYLLIKYKKYRWVSLLGGSRDLRIYSYAFPIIRGFYKTGKSLKDIMRKISFFRILYRRVKNVWKRRNDIILFLRYIKAMMFSDAILLQTPLHGNLGDHAIAKAETDLLSDLNISYCEFPWMSGIEKICGRVTPNNKIILVHGGGYLGQLWPVEEERFRATLKAFHSNRIIVFPQTVFFDIKSEEGIIYFNKSKMIYESHPRLFCFVRESISLDFMKTYMPKVHVMMAPDMVMAMNYRRDYNIGDYVRRGALICMRNDKEKTLTEEEAKRLNQIVHTHYQDVFITDTVLDEHIGLDKRDFALKEKLIEFASRKLIVTDRLHGMIFSAITETPCVVIGSKSHKVRGCYEWLKDLDYIRFVNNVDEISTIIDEIKVVKPIYCWGKINKSMLILRDFLKQSISTIENIV